MHMYLQYTYITPLPHTSQTNPIMSIKPDKQASPSTFVDPLPSNFRKAALRGFLRTSSPYSLHLSALVAVGWTDVALWNINEDSLVTPMDGQ